MEVDRNEVEQGADGSDDESVRSDDSSADARDHDDDEDDNGQEEADGFLLSDEEEECGPVQEVEELISKLESDEWVGDRMSLEAAMLPHLVHRIERFRRALSGNTRITYVCVDVGPVTGDTEVTVSPEDFEGLGQLFASLESLKHISVTTWSSRTGFDNFTTAAAFMRQTTQIQYLLLEVFPRRLQRELGFDAQVYTDALRHLTALESLRLMGLSPKEIAHITTALPSLSNLNSVAIYSHANQVILDDEVFQQLLKLAATLRRFRLSGYVLSECNLLTISEWLSTDVSHLESLSLPDCQFPNNECESLAASLKHNRTLESLRLRNCAPGDRFFRTLKESLSENTSLEILDVTGSISEESAIDLVAAIRGNYSLRSVHFSEESPANGIDEHQGSVLRCIPLLNKAGRRYMIEEPMSAKRGLDVLMEVNGDLDCLFLHLLENPSLCTEMLRCVADRKKKADAIGHEDDEDPSSTTKKCRHY